MPEVSLPRITVNEPSSQAGTAGTRLIEINNLSLYYGPAQALKNISVQIRERVVTALPLNKDGPQLLEEATVIGGSYYLADPSGNLIGESDAVWVSRMLTAERTEDTRS